MTSPDDHFGARLSVLVASLRLLFRGASMVNRRRLMAALDLLRDELKEDIRRGED